MVFSIFSQEKIVLTYDEAVEIALNESYTIKSYKENKKAMHNYFMYHKAQFKPMLGFNLFAPSWQESVLQINQTEGLPVYNSTGSLKFGGNLDFTYILPTGGNLFLYSNLYQENIQTVLALQDNERLTTDQFFTQVGIGFSQPIFTKNTLKENLKEAEILYNREINNYTIGQMNIIYDVTVGFYSLFRQFRVVEINEEKLNNSEETYRIALLKYKNKKIAEADVFIAEVEMEKDKAVLTESVSLLEREKDLFKQQIGLDINTNIEVTSLIQLDTFSIDFDFAVEHALKNRLKIANDSLNVELRKIDLDRAKREKEFKGMISAYYDFAGLGSEAGASTGVLISHSIENMGIRPPNRGITLSFSFPIYDWGRASAKKQQSYANLKDAELELDNSKFTIISEVRHIIRTIEESKIRVNINTKNEKLASMSYDISALRFKNGDITSQQLAQEQERLSQAQLAFLDSYITYQLAVADLKRKTMWDFKNNRSYLLEQNKD